MDKNEILYKALENENVQIKDNIIKYKAVIGQLQQEKKQVIEEKKQVIEEKITAIDIKNTEIDNLKKYYIEIINQVSNERDKLQEQLDSIINSRSYKITQKLKKIIKK